MDYKNLILNGRSVREFKTKKISEKYFKRNRRLHKKTIKSYYQN